MIEVITLSAAALALPGLAAEFLKILVAAQVLRPTKTAWVGDTLEWIIYERGVMLGAVNAVRVKHGFEPVTLAEIEKAEIPATGHVDYSRKFALYCAELALALPPWPRKKAQEPENTEKTEEKDHE